MIKSISSQVLFFVLLLLVGLSIAFQKPKPMTRQDLIDQKIEGFVTNYKKNELEKCRDKILETAGQIVDSLLIERAKQEKDTISKPPVPIKPTEPERMMPKDSTPIAPLFQDSTQY